MPRRPTSSQNTQSTHTIASIPTPAPAPIPEQGHQGRVTRTARKTTGGFAPYRAGASQSAQPDRSTTVASSLPSTSAQRQERGSGKATGGVASWQGPGSSSGVGSRSAVQDTHSSQSRSVNAPSTHRMPRLKQTARKSTGEAPSQQQVSHNTYQSAGSARQSKGDYIDSFGGYENFMISYGLKPWDDEDIEMGSRILEEFGKY